MYREFTEHVDRNVLAATWAGFTAIGVAVRLGEWQLVPRRRRPDDVTQEDRHS